MSHSGSYGLSPDLMRKWLALAERRRDYFADVYQTGRWRRFFDERELVRRTREAVELVETWTSLSAARDSIDGRVPHAHGLEPPASCRRSGETVT